MIITASGTQHSLISNVGTQGLRPDSGNSRASSAEVKNAWS
jgi:hypothetical protein